MFEWSVRAGDVLTLIGGISIAAAFVYNRGGGDATVALTLKAMSDQLEEMKREFVEFRKAMTRLAVQDERLNGISQRLNTMDTRYDELRHGRGWVQESGGIDREYSGS